MILRKPKLPFLYISLVIKCIAVFFLIFLLLPLHSLQAQTPRVSPNEFVEEKPIRSLNEFTGGLTLHSSSWGISLRRLYHRTAERKFFFEMDYVGIRHPKEIKSVNPYFEQAKSYVYGKLNTLNVMRLGAGQQHLLYRKAERSGVEIRAQYSGGLTLGFLKPVYLEILKPTGTFGEFAIAVERYDPDKHFTDNIYGRAAFTEGIGELKLRPGAYAKAGFNFEYATHHSDVKAIEVGALVDLFPTEVPIMANTDNYQLFLSLYITVMYGAKW